MRIATWNVNSIKARFERAMDWVQRTRPDIVCLQELKVQTDDFPFDEFAKEGYSAAVNGQRTYNGVAILSTHPIEDVRIGFDDGEEEKQARLITATTAGVTVMSIYVPNGKTVGSDKWDYKLDWLDRLRAHLDDNYTPADRLALGGDFNIAPETRDVARPERWRQSVLCDEGVREKWRRLQAWGLHDAVRLHHHDDGPYSWWDYRMLAFPKGDGLRIDHILLTETVADRCTDAFVERDERKGKKPSDHAPVTAVLSEVQAG